MENEARVAQLKAQIIEYSNGSFAALMRLREFPGDDRAKFVLDSMQHMMKVCNAELEGLVSAADNVGKPVGKLRLVLATVKFGGSELIRTEELFHG